MTLTGKLTVQETTSPLTGTRLDVTAQVTVGEHTESITLPVWGRSALRLTKARALREAFIQADRKANP